MEGNASGVSDAAQLDTATIFDLLGHHRRRFALSYLQDATGPVSVTTLAEVVAAHELGKTPAEVPPEHLDIVRISLFHTHLPKLADAEVVTVDEDSEQVTPTERASPLYAHLELEDI